MLPFIHSTMPAAVPLFVCDRMNHFLLVSVLKALALAAKYVWHCPLNTRQFFGLPSKGSGKVMYFLGVCEVVANVGKGGNIGM